MKVIHEINRGIKLTWYNDDLGSFGFSSRAAYAMGIDKPHYPVPAVRTKKIRCLSKGYWSLYWYRMGLQWRVKCTSKSG